MSPSRLLPEQQFAPPWLRGLTESLAQAEAVDLTRTTAPEDGSGRHSAVLMLLSGEEVESADLLLLQRSSTMRSHPGQVAFPGGATDPTDASPVDTALREAAEEVGLRRDTVDPLIQLPALFLPPSRFLVSPVLAYWREPHEVSALSVAEVARVARVPLAELVDPANRFTVTHPSGFVGSGFSVAGLFVWGFTAGLIDRMLALGGLEQPWDHDVVRPLPDKF